MTMKPLPFLYYASSPQWSSNLYLLVNQQIQCFVQSETQYMSYYIVYMQVALRDSAMPNGVSIA